ncbi:hypothetical protein [Tuberibacillus sp. Marseille-P3662]|uniref:hypothetical protein n=1 Tax=Tuberibacillus sp. Marseille-P3662 TaxID=1965358 RepID=UPI000A1C91BF|nr:hypothetical protein [Tuberibacillus sp. Marseille-P3662]
MKKSKLWLLAAFLTTAVMLSACASGGNEGKQSKEDTKQNQGTEQKTEKTSLTKGIDKVLTSLQTLNSTAESSTNDVKKINKNGKALSESWEPIEKKVEKHNAKAYENIEKSLYPLIAEAKKDHPDANKVKQLIEETTKQLKSFKQKLSSSS